MAQIHASAFVSPKAELAQDVIIGPCAMVEDNVFIGEGTRVDAFASIKAYTRLGKGNHIHSYALLGGEPQDLKFHGEVSWLEVGDHNNIREFATLHRGTEGGGGLTRIGSHNLIMAYCHVAHDCLLGDHIVMSNNATLAGHCEVGDWAILSGLCAVHQFTRIGSHAFLGGMSGAAQDLPPWMLGVGLPHASVISPNLVGMRRANLAPETVSAFKQAFRQLWDSALPREEALKSLEKEYGHMPEVAELLTFIRNSPRGVMPRENRKK